MQKTLWLGALAFVTAAVTAVTVAEMGRQHPDSALGRLVMNLKPNEIPAVSSPAPKTIAGPMLDMTEIDDRAALRGLKMLAMAGEETMPTTHRRAQDFREDVSVVALNSTPAVRIQEEEKDDCALCRFLCAHAAHRYAMAQMKLCDFRQAMESACVALVAVQDEQIKRAACAASACVAQECCPPPCGYWHVVEETKASCCGSKPCCGTKGCCAEGECAACSACCVKQIMWETPLPLVWGCGGYQPCCPCATGQIFVIKRREEPKAVAPRVQVKVVGDSMGIKEAKSGINFQVEIEIRLGNQAEATKEVAAKKCCAVLACEAVNVKKCDNACKCGAGCKCCAKPCTQPVAAPVKCSGCCEQKKNVTTAAPCPGCCEQKKIASPPTQCPGCCTPQKGATAEPCKQEPKVDPGLQQAGFVGAAKASNRNLRMMTRMIPVGDLLDAGTNEEQLVKLCMERVCNDCWQDAGGDGHLVYYAPGRCLIARQTYEVLEELEEYVGTLRRQFKNTVPPDNEDEGTYFLPHTPSEPYKVFYFNPRLPKSGCCEARYELLPLGSTFCSADEVVRGVGYVCSQGIPCRNQSDERAREVQASCNAWLLYYFVPTYGVERLPR